jgi:4-oxalocrotonate tautomerase
MPRVSRHLAQVCQAAFTQELRKCVMAPRMQTIRLNSRCCTHSVEEQMPLARIDIVRGKSVDYKRTIADVVYEAMLDTLKAPANDRFQVITEHMPESHIADESYLGIKRTQDCVFIQLTLNAGRSIEQKKAFYKTVADGLHERIGLRREDVFINLVEVAKENWSFGNGVAQYAS